MSGVYLDRLLKAVALGTLDPGSISLVDVRHDTWCPVLKQRVSACACDPVITITARSIDGTLKRFIVRADGVLEEKT